MAKTTTVRVLEDVTTRASVIRTARGVQLEFARFGGIDLVVRAEITTRTAADLGARLTEVAAQPAPAAAKPAATRRKGGGS